MKYMLLIHRGTLEWDRLSEDEQKRVYADYQAVSATPGVTPGAWMEPPELATTVRVDGDKTLTTDGPPQVARCSTVRSRSTVAGSTRCKLRSRRCTRRIRWTGRRSPPSTPSSRAEPARRSCG